MSPEEKAIQVAHSDADTISFVGQEDRGVVQMWFLNMEEKRPVELIAEFEVGHFERVMQSAFQAKQDAKGT